MFRIKSADSTIVNKHTYRIALDIVVEAGETTTNVSLPGTNISLPIELGKPIRREVLPEVKGYVQEGKHEKAQVQIIKQYCGREPVTIYKDLHCLLENINEGDTVICPFLSCFGTEDDLNRILDSDAKFISLDPKLELPGTPQQIELFRAHRKIYELQPDDISSRITEYIKRLHDKQEGPLYDRVMELHKDGKNVAEITGFINRGSEYIVLNNGKKVSQGMVRRMVKD